MNVNTTMNFSYNIPNQLVSETVSGNKVPSELIEKIFSTFDPADLPATMLVSQAFKEASLFVAKHHEFSLMIDLFEFINEKVNNGWMTKKLQDLFNDKKEIILGSLNFPVLKLSNKKIKEDLILGLQNLSKDNLEIIKKASETENKPKIFEEILFLAIIKKRINEIIYNQHMIPNVKNHGLSKICSDLSAKGYVNEAVDLAYTIPDETIQRMAISSITFDLLKIGNVDKAIKIADATPKGQTFYSICEHLLKEKNVEKVKELANAQNNNTKYMALIQLCPYLAKNGEVDESIEWANKLTDECERNALIYDIACILSKNGNVDKAIELGRGITDEAESFRTLYRIARNLHEQGDVVGSKSLRDTLQTDRLSDAYPFWEY